MICSMINGMALIHRKSEISQIVNIRRPANRKISEKALATPSKHDCIDPVHGNSTTQDIAAQYGMAGWVFGYHVWVKVPSCNMQCDGPVGGVVTNFGGTYCWGNIQFDCAAIKAASVRQNIEVDFGAWGLTVTFKDMGSKQYQGGCGK
jgi:hypothetical protein